MRAYGAAISFIDPLIKKETTKKPRTGNTGIQAINREAIRYTSEAVAIRERQEFKAGTKLSHASDSRERRSDRPRGDALIPRVP